MQGSYRHLPSPWPPPQREEPSQHCVLREEPAHGPPDVQTLPRSRDRPPLSADRVHPPPRSRSGPRSLLCPRCCMVRSLGTSPGSLLRW